MPFGSTIGSNYIQYFFEHSVDSVSEYFIILPSIPKITRSFFDQIIVLIGIIISQIVAVYNGVSAKDMELTLQAFYYLAIQLYVFSEVYSSLYKTRVLREFYDCVDGNMEKSNSVTVDMIRVVFH